MALINTYDGNISINTINSELFLRIPIINLNVWTFITIYNR